MMDYAKSVIFKILSEGVGQDKIIDAIKKRYEVKSSTRPTTTLKELERG